jgi:hypothetical protein
MIQQPTQGIIYAAPGVKFVNETLISARSVKQHNPQLSITLFTDCEVSSPYIDNIIHIDPVAMRFMDKLLCMHNSPYLHTIFLDCDTFVCADISELFSLLPKYDIALVQAPFRVNPLDYQVLKEFMGQIPVCFPQFNSGVVVFRQSAQVQAFLNTYIAFHQRDVDVARKKDCNLVGDQPALRDAIYRSELRVSTLPSEYNCRFYMPTIPYTIGFLGERVKILHGRAPDLDAVQRTLNSVPGPRVHILRRGVLNVQNFRGEKASQRLWWDRPVILRKLQRLVCIMREQGIASVIHKIMRKRSNQILPIPDR